MKAYSKFFLDAARISLGTIFLWAFLDKTFGFGFGTQSSASWLAGGSPTEGFLSFATKGPLAEFFQMLAGLWLIDVLFMAGLLGIGLCLILNRFVRWAGLAGAVMMVLMYLAALPPANNPLVDEHIVYAFVLLYFASQAPYHKTFQKRA